MIIKNSGFNDHKAMLDLCQEQDLASLNRVPLLMGVLTGRWTLDTNMEENDPRAQWFEHEDFRKVLVNAEKIGPSLASGGRSYVQGALGWIWARSPRAIPLPGFRNLEQVSELVQAMQFGPLSLDAMQAIADLVVIA